MKILSVLTACFCAAILLASSAFATSDQEAKQRKIKLVTMEGGDATVINVENDLALGETREIVTDEGKTITVSRSFDDEVKVLIDGEELELPEADGEHRSIIKWIEKDGEGSGNGEHRKVIVHRHVETDCQGDDCQEADHQHHQKVRKVIVLGDGENLNVEGIDGKDIDIKVLGLDAEGMTMDDMDIDIDCEEDDDDCEAQILELLGDTDGEDDKTVVVIKKRVTDDEDDD